MSTANSVQPPTPCGPSRQLHPPKVSWLLAWFVGLLLLGVAATAHAQTNPQRLNDKDKITGFSANLNLTASYNLLGLRILSDIGYRWRLYASQSKALQQNFIMLGPTVILTPAFQELGAFVTVQPATIFTLRGMYRFRFQVPTFFSGAVFEDVARFDQALTGVTGHIDGENRLRTKIEEVQNQNDGRRVLPMSHILSVEAVLRFQFKGLTALFFLRYAKWWSTHGQTDRFGAFYEPGVDILMNNDEHLITINGLLGYQWKSLLFFASTNFVRAFNSQQQNWRMGPGVRWTIAPNWGPFKKPNLLLVLNWHIEHRWRAAAFDGVPLVAIAFGGVF